MDDVHLFQIRSILLEQNLYHYIQLSILHVRKNVMLKSRGYT